MSAYQWATVAVLAVVVWLLWALVHGGNRAEWPAMPEPAEPLTVDDIDAATPELDPVADDLVARLLPTLLAADYEQHVANALAMCDADYRRLAGE